MSLSHQSLVFNSPAAGATVAGPGGYYGSYNNYTNDFYNSASDHLDFTTHHHLQTALPPSHHQHAAAYASSFPAASYGMLSALHGGAVGPTAGLSWYDGLEVLPPPPLDTATVGFTARFDATTSTATAAAAFRRLPTVDVKPETAVRMTESRTTGRSGGRSACRELSSDVDVSYSIHLFLYLLHVKAQIERLNLQVDTRR